MKEDFLLPAFEKNSIPVCFSTDDKYVLYLGVCLQSIKDNNKAHKKYDIVILHSCLSELSQTRLMKLSDSEFSIRFQDITRYLKMVDVKMFYVHDYYSIATYYRFFISEIFKNYEKVDCDMVVCHDLNDLYQTNLGSSVIGAVIDTNLQRLITLDSQHWLPYLKGTLKLINPNLYFNAGLLVFNIAKLKQCDFAKECLSELLKIGQPDLQDQDILNKLLHKKYQKLDLRWNMMWQLPNRSKKLEKELSPELYQSYMESRKDPWIIHFTELRPWDYPQMEFADIWWFYARKTLFYEQILFESFNKKNDAVPQRISYSSFKYLKYFILSKITFGKIRKKYKQKKRLMKERRK